MGNRIIFVCDLAVAGVAKDREQSVTRGRSTQRLMPDVEYACQARQLYPPHATAAAGQLKAVTLRTTDSSHCVTFRLCAEDLSPAGRNGIDVEIINLHVLQQTLLKLCPIYQLVL